MARKLIETQKTTLTYGISNVSTTIQLKNLLKLDGTSIAASDIGDLLYGTFGPGTSKEEIFSINGANVTVETNGNITITGVVRGLMEVSPYTTGGFSTDHSSGEVVIFGNNPQVYQDIYDYINDAIVGGGVDASTTVKGISKLSTAPASPSNPIAVGDNDPRIPTTNYTAAMAGTLGTPSATNKFVTQDNVYTGETDQEQATQNATVEFGMPNTSTNKNKIVQSFIPVKTKIRGVKLYKAANTGTFTGTVTVELFANSAGNPTGSALASKTFTNVEYNALVVGEFETLFSAEYSMTTGSTYHLVISASTADGSNHPNLGTNSAGGYANGSVKYWNTTDGYVAVATIDLYFKTLQGENSQVVQTDSTGAIPLSMFDISKMPIPAYYQRAYKDSSTFYSGSATTDGSVFVIFNGSGGAQELQRYKRDPLTGYYYKSHGVAVTPGPTTSSTIIVGSYIYIFNDISDNVTGYRYNLADLTGEVALTLPTISSSLDTWSLFSWTDGSHIFLVCGKASTTYYKMSISGTTLSTVTTGTCASNIFYSVADYDNRFFTMFDGTTVYFSRFHNDNILTFWKLNDLVASAITQISNDYIPSFTTKGSVGFVIPIDSQRMYLGSTETIYGDGDGSPVDYESYVINLYPFSKL